MAKDKTVYVCDYCGQESLRWVGKCPACGRWNTMKEMTIRADRPATSGTRAALKAAGAQDRKARPIHVRDIQADAEPRMDMGDSELNRVLGGGLVPGSLVLLGGEPGIGKSTLVLQTVLNLRGKRVLYVSGEESARQIKLRADRLSPDGYGDSGAGVGVNNPAVGVNNTSVGVNASDVGVDAAGEADEESDVQVQTGVSVLCETSLEQIFLQIEAMQPDLVVIDSIQTIQTEGVESSPGSLSQIRECAASLLKYGKSGGVSILLIGHITKEGSLAGPKVLEHIVDTVLQFEGDQHYMYRILRSIKNRFGSTSELGIYEMRHEGLRQVSNPSELLLTDNREGLSGVAIACTVEGVRPFLTETQALVSTAAYGTAQRSTTGFDGRRLNMLLAVLEKRVGFKLAQKDVFLNIAGGLRVTDPAVDLSVVASVLSSNGDMPIEPGVCMTGEVGLSGEIRPVARIEQRIAEAQKLGFRRILLPAANMKGLDPRQFSIELVPVQRVVEAVRELFG